MNSTLVPDKTIPEEQFRDHLFTTRAIDAIKKLAKGPEYFMVAIGFKLPHISLRIPYKYYDMYKNRTESWRLTKKESRFPHSAPTVSFRCCGENNFRFMNEEGTRPATRRINFPNINLVFTDRMRDEIMLGYCGAITFLDKQLGRLLDTLDELQLWNNVTVVLTSDHGNHNGEKGIW
jgi:iduronate 2-sulfatase